MSNSICLLCHNAECDNSQQFKEDRQVCSSFKHEKVIDWEQRRYEIAKDILANIIGRINTSAYSYEELAIKYADSLIKQLREK